MSSGYPHLPVLQPEPIAAERADAVRNRERILCAARRLFAERGPGCVSMDDIAQAAGVGKGTLFRRFGSRAQLASAVLDEQERQLQEGLIRGEPPLGPGAPPVERLVAFGHAWIDLLAENSEILAAAEAGVSHFENAPYQVHRLHITLLLREADPSCDADYLGEVLMAALAADRYVYLRHGRGIEIERLKAGWEELVRRVVPAGVPAVAAA